LMQSVEDDGWSIHGVDPQVQAAVRGASVTAVLTFAWLKLTPFVFGLFIICGFCLGLAVAAENENAENENPDIAIMAYVFLWVCRQAFLSMILAMSFAEMKTSRDVCCECFSHFCATIRRRKCLLCSLLLAFGIPIGSFLVVLFFLIRIVRVSCCCCMTSSRWLNIGLWHASEGDFISVLVVLGVVDLVLCNLVLFNPSAVGAEYWALKVLWQGLTLPTALLVWFVWARCQTTQSQMHAVASPLTHAA